MVQVLSARLRKLRPAEECDGTSEVFLCYGSPQKKARRRSEESVKVQFNSKMVSMDFARGPRSLQEMFDPTVDLRSSLEARPQYIRNIQNFCRYGLESSDAYSGVCMNRQSDFLLDFVLEPYLVDSVDNYFGRKVVFHTASSDTSASCRAMLCGLSEAYDDGISCVFGMHRNRLAKEHLEEIDKLIGEALPNSKCSEEELTQKQNNHEGVREYLKQNGEVLFHMSSKAWCHKHKKNCIVRHLPRHVPGLHPMRLRSSGGGVTCTGWCSPGLQKRFSDQSEPHHDIFIAERRQEAITEEWSWVECSGRKLYPIDVKVAQPLAKTHFVKWVYVGPQHIGFPVGRERCFGFLGAHFGLRWVGPDTQEEVQAAFQEFCFRQMEVDARICFQSTDAELRSEYRQLLEKRNIYDPDELPINRETFERCLPPGAVLRFREHVEVAEKRIASNLAAISDIDHWVGSKNGQCGPWIAAILTHGMFYNFNDERMATIKDMCLCQGLDSHGLGPAAVEARQLLDRLLAFKRRDAMAILGNGLNPLVFLRFQLFMMANCVRVELPTVQHALSASEPADDIEDHGGKKWFGSDDELEESSWLKALDEALGGAGQHETYIDSTDEESEDSLHVTDDVEEEVM